MLPIIHALRENKEVEFTVLLMTQEEQSIAIENNIEYKMLDVFSTKQRKYDFDLGWGLEPLINAIDQIDPDLFIAIEVNFILRNAIRYCKERKTRSIVVQHGTPNKYSLHAFVPFEGDLFLAWGDFSKEFLVQNNMPSERVTLTGGIHFDRTLSIVPDKDQISKTLGIDPAKKWVLFTTQGSGTGGIPTLEEIHNGVVETARAMENSQNVQLIYQVHPSQDIDSIKEILENVPSDNYIICKYKDTEELISASDAMITFFSTTAMDAVLLKKPLLLINLSDDRDFFPFEKMGVAKSVTDARNIRTSIKEMLNGFSAKNKSYDEVANFINYKNDGKALQRVMTVITETLGA